MITEGETEGAIHVVKKDTLCTTLRKKDVFVVAPGLLLVAGVLTIVLFYTLYDHEPQKYCVYGKELCPYEQRLCIPNKTTSITAVMTGSRSVLYRLKKNNLPKQYAHHADYISSRHAYFANDRYAYQPYSLISGSVAKANYIAGSDDNEYCCLMDSKNFEKMENNKSFVCIEKAPKFQDMTFHATESDTYYFVVVGYSRYATFNLSIDYVLYDLDSVKYISSGAGNFTLNDVGSDEIVIISNTDTSFVSKGELLFPKSVLFLVLTCTIPVILLVPAAAIFLHENCCLNPAEKKEGKSRVVQENTPLKSDTTPSSPGDLSTPTAGATDESYSPSAPPSSSLTYVEGDLPSYMI